MKKALSLLFNRTVIVVLCLLAFALLVWIVGPLVSIANAHPLDTPGERVVLIVAVILVYVLVRVWRAWRARVANKTIVDQLIANSAAGAKGGADGKDAASDAELAAMQQRFEQSLKTLKEARFEVRNGTWSKLSARLSRRYLYELPWYMIIGAPGSGKTTALLNSGLQFPIGEGSIRGVGGTRNCDWWFTDQAVLIDTAGRFTTQDSNRAVDPRSWLGFLSLLRKGRPAQPLNGVMITVSAVDLLTGSVAARQAYAAVVRARVEELHKQLGVRFPIYVLVTKTDLLAGFVDYLGDADKETRQDPWGFTFPLASSGEARMADLSREFDALEQRLLDGLIDRLQPERDVARRSRIYAFPTQFASLKAALADFVAQAFSPSKFETEAFVRGVYFVSGTQEGTPIDRALGTIARTYGLERSASPANQPTGKSFFLTRLLSEVVFAESHLSGTNLKWQRRRSWLASIGYGVIAVTTVALLIAWTVSYRNNKSYIAETEARVARLRTVFQATPNEMTPDVLAVLAPLDGLRELSDQEAAQAVPLSLGFGLYQGRKFQAAARQTYARLLDDVLQPRIALQVETQLKTGADNAELQYEALKTETMLHDPTRFDANAVRLFITAYWEATLPRELTAQRREALELHLKSLLDQGPAISPLPVDRQLVEQTRSRLASVPLAQRVYNRLKHEGVAADIPEFSIARAAGPSAAIVFTRASGAPLTRGVPGLFTYDGYHRGFQQRVERTTRQLSDEEPWVLASSADASTAAAVRDTIQLQRLANDVRVLYLQDYVKQWDAFLADIQLLPATDLAQAVQMTRILSAPDSPLPPLLRGIGKETTLTVPDGKSAVQKAQDGADSAIRQSRDQLAKLFDNREATASASGDGPVENIVDEHFANLHQLVKPGADGKSAPIDVTLGMLGELYTLLTATDTAIRGGNAPPPSDVPNKVRAESARMPDPLRGLLTSLSQSGNSATLGATRASLSSSVNSSVGEFCRQALTGRYPFARASKSDITQEDFARLFAPNGSFDAFFQHSLASYVDTSTRPWSFRQLGETRMAADTMALAQFQRAAAIRDTFFRPGGTAASLRLVFKPLDMDASITQFNLDIDGQAVKYAHGPQIPTEVTWPGPRGSTQVRLQLQPASASGTSGAVAEGPWALFRLFDRFQMTPGPTAERFVVTFNVDGRKASFEVTASSVQNPFRLRELAEFSCPTGL